MTWAWAVDAVPGNLNTVQLKTQVFALVRQENEDKYPHLEFAEAPDYEAIARE